MKRRAMELFLAGSALVLLVNAIVLAGVAWNRSGTPAAMLALGERELELPPYWYDRREDSGLALNLRWRLPVTEATGDGYAMYPGPSSADWLDAAALEALGFRLPPLPDDPSVRVRNPPARELWLVLEFDGPAYAHSLELARRVLAAAEDALQANPAQFENEQRVANAREQLQRASTDWSRLFVVDAGRDPGVLRSRHAERERHALVRGIVRPYLQRTGPAEPPRLEWRGWVESISVDRVHVPLGMRPAFGMARGEVATERRNRYEVMLAYGRRGEPWIVAARPVAAQP